MASCVARVAHRSLLGPSRLSADGVWGCPCATECFSHNKGYLGRRPLARRREQAPLYDQLWSGFYSCI